MVKVVMVATVVTVAVVVTVVVVITVVVVVTVVVVFSGCGGDGGNSGLLVATMLMFCFMVLVVKLTTMSMV